MAYTIPPGDTDIVGTLTRILADIDVRLKRAQEATDTLPAAEREFRSNALKRISADLAPMVDTLRARIQRGVLTATSDSEVLLVGGVERTWVIAEADRTTFAPSPYVLALRRLSILDTALLRVTGWDSASGAFTAEVLEITGNPGPHTDWEFVSGPGVVTAQRAWLAEGRAARAAIEALEVLVKGYRDAAAGSATATGLDRTQTELDRIATGQDRTATGQDRVQTGLDRKAVADGLATIAGGPVASVNGRTGIVLLDPLDASPVRPTLDLRLAGQGLRRGWFNRLSAGYRRRASGLLESVAAGIPRIDHDAAGVNLGTLFDEARTTLTAKSRRLDDAAVWTLTSLATSPVAGVDGILASATRLTATAANATVLAPATSLASAARRLDPFIRRVAGTGPIDLSLDGGATWTTLVGITSAYTRLGIGQTLANPRIALRIATSGDQIDVDFMGGETGPFATSPIESVSAIATRAADSLTVPVTAADWFNPSEGACFLDAFAPNYTGAIQIPLQIDDGSYSNRVYILRDANGNAYCGVTVSGTSVAYLFLGPWPNGARRRIAFAFAENNFAACMESGTAAVDTTGAMPTGLASFRVGSAIGAAHWNGPISRVAYVPRRLDNTTLQRMAA